MSYEEHRRVGLIHPDDHCGRLSNWREADRQEQRARFREYDVTPAPAPATPEPSQVKDDDLNFL